ncbi:MAG: tetratricopeptide repeat protein [Candidatus Cloacimonetes bacterium]|nr:tetratricopeptide repeat protein [Candidatus Cloacimonadota bacterium]
MCKYTLKKNKNFTIKARVDSHTELIDLLKNEIDFWITNPQQIFSNKIPLQMVEYEAGKAELTKFFINLKIPEDVPIKYLIKRLNMNGLTFNKANIKSLETYAFEFLDKIIVQNWENTIADLYFSKNYDNPDYQKNYLDRISKHTLLKKMTRYELISSSLSENKQEALVHFEFNSKYDITLIMRLLDNKWKVFQKIFGEPSLYIGENESIRQIAVLLSKKDLGNVFPLLTKFSNIFPDSADFQYYWSMYYTISGHKDKSLVFLKNAMEMDPNFIEAKYNYAFILHTENRLSEAEKYYKEILEIADDANSFNNLASIYIGKGKYKEAKILLDKCLKLKPDFNVAQKNLDRLNKLNS